MRVDGDLLGGECDLLHAPFLAELVGLGDSGALPRMNRHSSLQVGEVEGFLSITAVCRADEGEQRVVLRNRHRRPVAECPARRSEVAAEHPNLTDEWLTHDAVAPLSIPRREDALKGDDEVQHQERLPVLMRLRAADVGDAGRR